MNGSAKKPRVYYARGVDGLQRSSVALRAARARNELARHRVEVVDPVELGRAANAASVREIVENDLRALRECDAVLMDMSIRNRNYIGCCCELVYAFEWQIPAIVYVGRSGNGGRVWLVYHATAICTSLSDALSLVVTAAKTNRIIR